MRSNRKGLPRACLATRLQNQEVYERRKGPLLCVAYKDKKNRPVLLSTATMAGYSDVRNRRGADVRKPRCVVLYNKVIGGVDLSDAKLYTYLSERRTMKWTTKLAFALIGRAILNSFIIYENTSDMPKLTRYMYMVKVVESLAGDHYPGKVVRRRRSRIEIEAARCVLAPQIQPPVADAAVDDGHTLVELAVGKKRNCAGMHDRRVRSGWECRVCDVGLCPVCFVAYHKRPRN